MESLYGIMLTFYNFEDIFRYACFRLHHNARFCYRRHLAESVGKNAVLNAVENRLHYKYVSEIYISHLESFNTIYIFANKNPNLTLTD